MILNSLKKSFVPGDEIALFPFGQYNVGTVIRRKAMLPGRAKRVLYQISKVLEFNAK